MRAMPLLGLLALLLLLAPAAGAQENTSMGNEGYIPPGADEPGPEESVETGPGISYGTFLLVGMLLFVGAFGWAAWRYARRPPPP